MKYEISDRVTYEYALDLGTELIAREAAWRKACLDQGGMSDLERDFCERDLRNLEAARAELEARQEERNRVHGSAALMRFTRQRCGVSQAKAAAEVGVSVTTWNRWERADYGHEIKAENAEAVREWARVALEDHLAAARGLADRVQASEDPRLPWSVGSGPESVRYNAVALEAAAILAERGVEFEI